MKLGKDRYQLELHWESVLYLSDDLAIINDAYFSGPALKISQKINDADEINIDMTKQFRIFIPDYYIAKIKWEGVIYKDNKIYFKNMLLRNKHLHSIPKVKNTDYFVIDTEKHEEETHAFYPNYDCYLVNELGELYKF